MKNSKLTKEFLKDLLTQFNDSEVKISGKNNDLSLIDIYPENTVSGNVFFEIDGTGIRFYLKQTRQIDFNIEQSIRRFISDEKKLILSNDTTAKELFVHSLDQVSPITNFSERFINAIKSNIKVYIGRIYFSQIKSIEITETGITINNTQLKFS